MNPSRPDGKTIDQWLQHQPSGVRNLLDRARLIADVTRELHRWSPDPWITQIRVANIRDHTVVIHAASASALVPLRYRRQALLTWLNDRFQLECTELEAKVRPATTPR